ncbi:MAG: signal peptidase II [Vagococcus sp.]
MVFYGLLIGLLVLLDQVIKIWVVNHIVLYETIGHNSMISLTYIRNNGAAWSILEGKMWFFIVVTLVALLVFPYMLYKNKSKSKWLTVGLACVIGGTIGNFIDRMRLNYVVDMFQLEFIDFPIFNFADVALTVGVICIFIYILFFEGKETEKH